MTRHATPDPSPAFTGISIGQSCSSGASEIFMVFALRNEIAGSERRAIAPAARRHASPVFATDYARPPRRLARR